MSGLEIPQIYWNPVIPELAAQTTVVTYDRAGVGKSEIGALPAHGEQSAKDLRVLLAKLGVPKPYILVGHSFGGNVVRLFASLYPNDMGGLILEETQHEDNLIELRRILKGKDLEAFEQIMADRFLTPEHPKTEADYANITREQLRKSKPLPRIPFVVMTVAGRAKAMGPMFSDEALKKMAEADSSLNDKLVAMIPGGRLILVEGTGHNVHVDKPGVLIAPLMEMVREVREKKQSPKPDPRTAGSDVVGKLLPVRDPTSMVGIPTAHQRIMEANLQGFVAVVLRHPALQPPVGFDFRTGTHAYAPPQPVSPYAPLAYTMTGLFYWYTYMPAYQQIRPFDLAMQGFFVRANDISSVFNKFERWPTDERGLTFVEPRVIRTVAGFPQYSTGVIVLKRNPRPIWVPVSREWALQRELAQRRKNLEAIAESAKAAEAYDPKAILEKWLKERPERQREMEKSYAEMKQSNSEYAEKIRASFFETEKRVEESMRRTASRQQAAPSRNSARLAAERSKEETCIRFLEGELARLSPYERSAPAYFSRKNPDRNRSASDPDCSRIVAEGSPDAVRVVTENPDYCDRDLAPSALQLILVDFSNFEGSVRVSPPWRHAAYERIRDGLDYSALAAMLRN